MRARHLFQTSSPGWPLDKRPNSDRDGPIALDLLPPNFMKFKHPFGRGGQSCAESLCC